MVSESLIKVYFQALCFLNFLFMMGFNEDVNLESFETIRWFNS